MRTRLYAVASSACLAVAALTLPGLANASPAAAATGPSAPKPIVARPVAPEAVSAAAAAAAAKPASAPPATLPSGAREACPKPTSLLQEQCASIVLPNARKAVAGHVATAVTAANPVPLNAADLQSIYGISSQSASGGTGQTVAIVDAYGDPYVDTDLQKYRANNGPLPVCDEANGCLNVYNQNGGTSAAPNPPSSEIGWENETSLDVDMVSAICPNCHIDLFEANTPSLTDLGTAENAAVAKGDKFISNSWSSSDFAGESFLDNRYFNHPGVAMTFASGDFGYGVYVPSQGTAFEASYPGSSQFVTSVGGLQASGSPGSWGVQVWNDANGATGSGCSSGEGKPSWQVWSANCANRTQNDVSGIADGPGGIETYYQGSQVASGGTSAAAPAIAAIYALAGTPEANTYPASYPYLGPNHDTVPVITGSNGTCESNRQYLCNAAKSQGGDAGPYYSGPAGLGLASPANGGDLSGFVAPTGNVVTLPNPGTYDLQAGLNYQLYANTASDAFGAIDSASGQTLTYSATGLPSGLTINPSTGVISGTASAATDATVKVTATDGSGDPDASPTVTFNISVMYSLTTAYHAGTGAVKLSSNGKCLDDNGDSSANGTKVQIWQCFSGDKGQTWSFLPDTDPGDADIGQVKINGKCLDIVGAGTANGTKVQLWGCNGRTNQQWGMSGAYGELYNPYTGKCLDDPAWSNANGTQLDMWSCTLNANQSWNLPASQIDSAMWNRCLNDRGGSNANGTQVISYTCDGSAPERWLVVPDGTIRINGKCLDDRGDGTLNGSGVDLWTCNGGSNQQWELNVYGQIESVNAEKCLSIPNDNNADAVTLQDCAGKRGEVWTTS